MIRRVIDALLFAGIATLPSVPWFLRNRRWTGSVTGFHDAPSTNAAQTIASIPRGIARWVGVDDPHTNFGVGVSLIVIVVAACVFVVFVRGARARSRPKTDTIGLGVMSIWTASYLGMLAYAAISAAEVHLPGRLMSPAFVPAVLIGIASLDGVVSTVHGRGPRIVAQVCALAMCVVVTIPNAIDLATTIDRARLRGLPFTPVQWQDVRVIAWVKEHGLAGDVYSNEPFALYRIANIDAIPSPRRQRAGFTIDERYSLANFVQAVHGGKPAYLVWFSIIDRDWLCTLDEVRAAVELEPVISFQDGAVLRVK